MDDCTIAITRAGSRDLLSAALPFTRHFGQQVGFQTNSDKTQVWSCEDHTPTDFVLEHLGIKYNPANVNSLITPKDPLKFEMAIQGLSHCPGNIDVRSKLVMAFIRSLQDWASPLFTPGTRQDAKALFRAVTRAKATWWC